MSLYWISWYQPTKDFRPMSYPPNKNILGWWKTGENDYGESILVAMVNVTSIDDIPLLVNKDWPEAINWRFMEERFSLDLSDRFPLKDWMITRFNKFKKLNHEII